jgi:hypothetical protein
MPPFHLSQNELGTLNKVMNALVSDIPWSKRKERTTSESRLAVCYARRLNTDSENTAILKTALGS